MYEKQYCITAIIVVIVKTKNRFWPRVHLLWISPAIKALACDPSAFTTLFAWGKSWDNVFLCSALSRVQAYNFSCKWTWQYHTSKSNKHQMPFYLSKHGYTPCESVPQYPWWRLQIGLCLSPPAPDAHFWAAKARPKKKCTLNQYNKIFLQTCSLNDDCCLNYYYFVINLKKTFCRFWL